MKHPRIAVNLAFFALLGVVLAIWAVRSIISVDALDRPFRVTAEFADSPGLNEDLEVTHLGVRVGKVGAIELRTGHVDVGLDLDRGVQVPAGVGARVLRKSAIGEPYIELTPPAKPGTAVLKAGDHIPVGRTAGTTDYQQLFAGIGDTLKAVDPRDSRTLVHELARGLEGRGTTINDTIADAHRLTGTLAADAHVLDGLSAELTRLTATLSDHRYQLASGVNDLAAFTAALRQSRRDLDTVLEHGPGTLREANDLLGKARPGLGCLLTAAATPSTPLFTRQNQERIHHVLEMVPTLQALVSDITATDASGKYLRVTAVLTLPGAAPAAAEYTSPVPKPKPPALALCPSTPKTAGGAKKAAKAERAQAPRPAAEDATAVPTPVRQVGATGDAAPGGGPARWLPLLPPALGAVIVIAAAARFVRTLLRRRFP
ncbi:MCE family protein [Spirillospora sp. NPDC029432]|uniref:MCE family protein n=1 Tax=Spirillospora sp. NPDC029432 TaxID=3154599 RepID=UPI0034533A22